MLLSKGLFFAHQPPFLVRLAASGERASGLCLLRRPPRHSGDSAGPLPPGLDQSHSSTDQPCPAWIVRAVCWGRCWAALLWAKSTAHRPGRLPDGQHDRHPRQRGSGRHCSDLGGMKRRLCPRKRPSTAAGSCDCCHEGPRPWHRARAAYSGVLVVADDDLLLRQRLHENGIPLPRDVATEKKPSGGVERTKGDKAQLLPTLGTGPRHRTWDYIPVLKKTRNSHDS